MSAGQTDVINHLVAQNKRLLKACELFLGWLSNEDTGPQYPEGITRKSEEGELIWREWWDRNLRLCAASQDAARDAIASNKEEVKV